MAYVADEVFNKYIDRDGEYIATESESKPEHIEAIYRAGVLARFGKHAEAAECILPAVSSIDANPMKSLLLYYTLAEQYDKLIEWCNKIVKYDDRSDLVVIARLLLAMAYEDGKGVEQDLIQAFRYFNSVRFENNISDDDYKQVDEFLKRHPEMLELPEVKNALAPLDEDEDF
jgi:tetratricopeptide (TPR) repeat protein